MRSIPSAGSQCPRPLLRLRPGWCTGLLFLLLSLVMFAPGGVFAAGGGGDGGDELDLRDPLHIKAAGLIDKERYAEAEAVLREWVAKRPDKADAHNLLGYVARKQGRLREALEHYREALRLDPEHRGAHEYLGETWLALDDLEQAKVHLAFLDDDCWLPCEEYSDLKEAVERYERERRR